MKTKTSNTNTKAKHKQAASSEPSLTTQPSNSIPNDGCELNPTLDSQNPAKRHIKQITDQLFGVGIDSTNRLPAMLYLLNDFTMQPEVAWPVFHEVWNCCEPTWEHCDELLEFLEMTEYSFDGKTGCPRDYLSSKDKAAFDALPENIQIYRGCSLSNVYGFSWTTERKVAEGFAKGYRGISVSNPVIASLIIPKSEVIGFYTSRKESEVVINHRRFEKSEITVAKFFPNRKSN